MSWIIENKEWIFSGVGIAIIGLVYSMLSKRNESGAIDQKSQNTNNVSVNINQGVTNNSVPYSDEESLNTSKENRKQKSLEEYKNETKILFVDDDARFRVAKILVQSGWVHTKLIKDCKTLDEREVIDAHLLFIDVQGVGVAMGFNDEGLGLALALKRKYPDKKIIIYSAETKGDRFHEALREADSFLAKNADPYEFQRIVEEFTVGEVK